MRIDTRVRSEVSFSLLDERLEQASGGRAINDGHEFDLVLIDFYDHTLIGDLRATVSAVGWLSSVWSARWMTL